MEPIIELTVKGSDEVVAYACRKCGVVAANKPLAEQCCEPRICECGAESRPGWILCERCRRKKETERETDRFNKAKKVGYKEYDDPVSDGDGYWYSAEDYMDHVYPVRMPYVWACTRFGLKLNAQDIIESQLERDGHHEDAYDRIVDIEGLQQALDKWLAKQTMESWMVDYGRAVLLDHSEGEDNAETT